jgi:putative molybdopterin biosynthesis protein
MTSLADSAQRGARFGMRQPGAGARMLFKKLLADSGVDSHVLVAHAQQHPTAQDLADSMRGQGRLCHRHPRGGARAWLSFVPLAWGRFDLAMHWRTAFEPAAQALFARMREPEFARQAEQLGGYHIDGAGGVRLNR